MKRDDKFLRTEYRKILFPIMYSVLGVLFMLAGLFFSGPLGSFLAQGTSLMPLVCDYCLVTLLGSVPFLFSYTAINYLQQEGKMKAISAMVIMMVVSDVVLDLLFLYLLNLGMTGAALASVLSTLFATVYGFIALQKNVSNYKFHIRKLRFFSTRWLCFLFIGNP